MRSQTTNYVRTNQLGGSQLNETDQLSPEIIALPITQNVYERAVNCSIRAFHSEQRIQIG